MLVVSMTVLQAQDDYADKYFPKIRERLKEGNCERAQDLYNVYKQMTSLTDREIEQRIADCLNAKNGSKDLPQQGGTNQGNNLSFTVGGVQFTMVWVEGGTYTMGCTSEQGGECYSDEKPAHSVTVSSYYMGETEVTQALWKAVMGNNPSYFKGDNLPVEQVTWTDAQEFIEKLNRLTGRIFRLPTEAEWEYAARGGNRSRGYKYSGSNSIDAVAWYWDNGGTHPVKEKQANELGLYDMSGNVYEWCSDWYGSYGTSSQRDPDGPRTGSSRVSRGGCWNDRAQDCRVSYRYLNIPSNLHNLGFRLVFVP